MTIYSGFSHSKWVIFHSYVKLPEGNTSGPIGDQNPFLQWMEEILHQMIDGLSHYLWGFYHPKLVVQDLAGPSTVSYIFPIIYLPLCIIHY